MIPGHPLVCVFLDVQVLLLSLCESILFLVHLLVVESDVLGYGFEVSVFQVCLARLESDLLSLYLHSPILLI